MADYSYVTIDALKAKGEITRTENDSSFRRLLQTATLQIDTYMNRTMRTFLATYRLTAQGPGSILLDETQLGLGLLVVTTLKTDGAADRTYDTTWATTDYDLEPFNAPNDKRPYWEVTKAPNGNNNFPRVAQGVEIVGKWGFFETLIRNVSLLDGAPNSSATTVTVDAGNTFEVLQTILVDSEQMYITSISGEVLTVVRGVNGTTAASHIDDSVIDVYEYPSDVVEATLMQSQRLWTRRPSGFSDEQGFNESGVMRPWVGMDHDVQEMLANYRLIGA